MRGRPLQADGDSQLERPKKGQLFEDEELVAIREQYEHRLAASEARRRELEREVRRALEQLRAAELEAYRAAHRIARLSTQLERLLKLEAPKAQPVVATVVHEPVMPAWPSRPAPPRPSPPPPSPRPSSPRSSPAELVELPPRPRSRFSAAFRAEAVRRILEDGADVPQLASSLGIDLVVLYRWLREATVKKPGAVAGGGA